VNVIQVSLEDHGRIESRP